MKWRKGHSIMKKATTATIIQIDKADIMELEDLLVEGEYLRQLLLINITIQISEELLFLALEESLLKLKPLSM